MTDQKIQPNGRVIAAYKHYHQYRVVWSVDAQGKHIVEYGHHFKTFERDADVFAAHEFGECVRHSAQCAGLL